MSSLRLGWLAGVGLIGLFAEIACGNIAMAHQPSEGFVIIEPLTTNATGFDFHARWDVALQDLDRSGSAAEVPTSLDRDGDGVVIGRELTSVAPRLVAWAHAGLRFATGGPCVLDVSLAGVTTRLDGMYASFEWRGTCPAAADGNLVVHQDALFATDPGHRALIRIGETSAVLRADAREARLSFAVPPGAFATFTTFVGEGVLHIWEGIDHVLFLLALLFPAVLRWRRAQRAREGIAAVPGDWLPAESLRPVIIEVMKVVTGFTVAHSLTLVLATLEVVKMPSSVVETAIALSVALAALNNLRPIVDARWTVAFGLGLLHGFGFSGVLLELGLPSTARALALVGFNVGVELGQIAIVLIAVPLAFSARRTRFYRFGIVAVGSLAIALLAVYWSAQRSGLV